MTGNAPRGRSERGVAKARARRRRRWLAGGVIGVVVIVIVAAVVSLDGRVAVRHGATSTHSTGQSPITLRVGSPAPNGSFATLAGASETIAQLRGRPTLLWFVTTWCSSCQASTQALSHELGTLAAEGVRVVEVENYADLGQSGPSMVRFAKVLGGTAASNPDWTFGEASLALTKQYNPAAYLDIYYLVNARGVITYVNSSPIDTMAALLAHARALA